MELNDIVVSVLTGIGIGVGLAVLYIIYLIFKVKKRIDQMVEEVIAEAESNMVGLDIELDKDTYFCYNSADKQFVCQGTTVEQIALAFRDRYPTKTAYLAGGDPVVVEQFKTELLKLATDENSTS